MSQLHEPDSDTSEAVAFHEEQKPKSKRQDQSSGLLRLPAELRNRIYDHVLVEEDPIPIEPGLKLPQLLSTCAQIREEATLLWFSENDFQTVITDCDSTSLQCFEDWSYHFQNKFSEPEDHFHPARSMEIRGAIKWSALEDWVKAVWSSSVSRQECSADGDKAMAIIVGAHDIAEQHLERSWPMGGVSEGTWYDSQNDREALCWSSCDDLIIGRSVFTAHKAVSDGRGVRKGATWEEDRREYLQNRISGFCAEDGYVSCKPAPQLVSCLETWLRENGMHAIILSEKCGYSHGDRSTHLA